MVTTGATRRANLVISTPIYKPTPSFLPIGCHSCHCTVSKRWKVSHSTDLLTPSSLGVLPTLSLITKGSWLSWMKIAKLRISPLTVVHHGLKSHGIRFSSWKLTSSSVVFCCTAGWWHPLCVSIPLCTLLPVWVQQSHHHLPSDVSFEFFSFLLLVYLSFCLQ